MSSVNRSKYYGLLAIGVMVENAVAHRIGQHSVETFKLGAFGSVCRYENGFVLKKVDPGCHNQSKLLVEKEFYDEANAQGVAGIPTMQAFKFPDSMFTTVLFPIPFLPSNPTTSPFFGVGNLYSLNEFGPY